MAISATILCENTVFSNIGAIAEHGWSVLLETGHGNFLFDTGQGKALLNKGFFTATSERLSKTNIFITCSSLA